MASNRRWTSQFSYSFERQAVRLMAACAQSGSTGTAATLVTQGVTLTAKTFGSAGNSITIQFTPGATAGAEVVTVTTTHIVVQIQSGVSTVTQVRTAINASTPAAALVTATGTSASTVATAAATPLATGTDTVFVTTGHGFTLTQTGTGTFLATFPQTFAAMIGCSIMIQKASATDLITQIASSDVSGAGTCSFRVQAAATPTNLASGDILFISFEMRNSGTNSN